jgi:TRAP-type C4-dicarboxylate transport system permease small subunit
MNPTLFRAVILRLVETICIVILVSLAAIVIYASSMRWLGASPSWYDEIAQVMLAWLTYFAAAYAALNGQHMRFSGIVLALPVAPRIVVFLLGEALLIIFFAIVGWYGWKLLEFLTFDALLSLRWVSMAWVQSVIPVTSGLIILATLMNLPRELANMRAGVDKEHESIATAIAEAEAENMSEIRK